MNEDNQIRKLTSKIKAHNSRSVFQEGAQNISSRSSSALRCISVLIPFSCSPMQSLSSEPAENACDDNFPSSPLGLAFLDAQPTADWYPRRSLPPIARTTYRDQFVSHFCGKLFQSKWQTLQSSLHSKQVRISIALELSPLLLIEVEVAWICRSFSSLGPELKRKSYWGMIASLVLSSHADSDERRRTGSSWEEEIDKHWE